MIIDEQQLDAIEQRAAKATAGPWTRARSRTDIDNFPTGMQVAATYGRQAIYAPIGSQHPANDAEFIAAARTDVPELVAIARAHFELRRKLKGFMWEGLIAHSDGFNEPISAQWAYSTLEAILLETLLGDDGSKSG